jgi:hypothetical protein
MQKCTALRNERVVCQVTNSNVPFGAGSSSSIGGTVSESLREIAMGSVLLALTLG